MRGPQVIVVGAGVSGLSCAHELAHAGCDVQVWASAMPAQTTSNVAAAFWYPYRVEPIERVAPWATHSYVRFSAMADDPALSAATGVVMHEAIELFPEQVPDPAWASGVRSFRHATPDERPAGYGHAVLFEAPVVEMPRYLSWLRGQLDELGVALHPRQLDSLSPALAQADIVVNTSGLGARELVDDPRVYPVRGQILHHARGSFDRVTIDEHRGAIAYIVPRGDDVVLGGVADEHSESLEVDEVQSREIFARCATLEPRLADTARLGVSVGLRPCRDLVRLEREQIQGTRVVHDYGHGGAGVTLSWGCAAEVRELCLTD